jgi:hypothetical protein
MLQLLDFQQFTKFVKCKKIVKSCNPLNINDLHTYVSC